MKEYIKMGFGFMIGFGLAEGLIKAIADYGKVVKKESTNDSKENTTEVKEES